MHPRRVILDTDPGIDDALAILLGLASPEIELAAVTVTGGNCPLAEGVQNALAVLALGGAPQLPVAAGVALPLIRPPFTAPETHGVSGLGYAQLPAPAVQPVADHAVDRIIDTIMAAPGEVTLVAVAPLTNVALAIRKEPRIVQAVREVIIMGGAVRADGNVTPLAEFNVYVDPHAAHIVLQSGMPITLLPWDITRDVQLTQADVDRLLAVGGPLPAFVAAATRFYIEFHQAHFGFAACSVNDPAALALAFLPDLARSEQLFVDVELTGMATLGKTVGDFLNVLKRPPNVRLVVEFDTPRFLQLFCERLAGLARRLNAAS